MKTILLTIGMLLVATSVVAQTTKVFDQPCERGPWQHVNIINESHADFVDFIQEVRPGMPRETASYIAHQVCADMRIVGNSGELTKRLNLLIRESGY